MTRRTIVTTEKFALEAMTPDDRFLYNALEENIQACRKILLQQGFSREERIELLQVLSQCRELQLKMISRPQSTEDTADFDVSGFKKL